MNVKSDNIDFYNLGFDFIQTRMMFLSEFKDGSWSDGELKPLRHIEVSPAACVLNYGQGIFEGMKALKTKKGDITLFRPLMNAQRFNKSAERLVMPPYNEKSFIDSVKLVVKANEDFIPPYESGGSLYIRPLMWSTLRKARWACSQPLWLFKF